MVNRQLLASGASIGKVPAKIAGQQLTPAQHSRYQVEAGQRSYTALRGLVTSPKWKTLDAESRQAEVAKVAESQIAEVQKNFATTVDAALKNAPTGSENAVALVKSAMAAANNAYESVSKAAKQAADVAEANFTAVTDTAVKASQAAKAKRA